MQKNYTRRYIILKNRIIDILAESLDECADCYNHSWTTYKVTKNKKLYCKVEQDVLEDWYADIGPIYKTEKERFYVGKVLFTTNNIETLLNQFMKFHPDFIGEVYGEEKLAFSFYPNYKITKKDLKNMKMVKIYNNKKTFVFENYERFEWCLLNEIKTSTLEREEKKVVDFK